MAVNITCTGNTYDTNGNIFTGGEVYYQARFVKINGSSSSSIWSNTRTSILGQYNFNLADSDLLTTEGNAASNDRVIVTFWKGSTTNRNDNCSLIEQCGAFEVILGTGPGMVSSDVYVNDVSITTNIIPILAWSLPSTGYVNTSYTATNNSYDTHSFTISGTTMYHWLTRSGQTINAINDIDNSDYYWGDLSSDLDVAGTTNKSHQWTAAGDYEVKLVIEDECTATVTGTKNIIISWHAPVPDIIMIPSVPDPNEPVSFQWNGTDTDNQIISISWTINDSGVYGNTDTTASGARDDIIPHSDGAGTDWCSTSASGGAFTNPGNHTVSIIYTWYDGASWHDDSYNEVFNQPLFSGPTVNFTQVPPQAVIASGVKFTNTSTSTSRVGLGLPNCYEYDWTFTDDGTPTEYLDKPYSYELEVTPGSADCQVELCADWSDGWDTQQTCVEKEVVFETTVTVTAEDCYYNLNVIGTADDGTAGSYSWTVASGTTQSGTFSTVWESPSRLDQQDKKVCFTSVGWYKITGYVHSSGAGASTSDYELLYVDVVCAGTDVCGFIWNGTGVLDEYGDWDHNHYGSEATYAKHTGTNGLDATGMTENDKIEFDESTGGFDASNYDSLMMWVNVQGWEEGKSIVVDFQEFNNSWGTSISLNPYLNITAINTWQRVLIPLEDFGILSYTYKRLRLTSSGDIGVYLDDIAFAVGTDVYYAVPIGAYDMYADELGGIHISGDEDKPSISVTPPPTPSVKTEDPDLRPSMRSGYNKPGLRAYPAPNNL